MPIDISNNNPVDFNELPDIPNIPGAEAPDEQSVQSSNNQQHAQGLSDVEVRDPNKIIVTIADQQTPVLVLFGPPSCGKTMTLVRLTRYLKRQGYEIKPEKTFRPAADIHYKNLCDGFDQMVNNNDAAKSTNNISFMLVKVLHKGRTICQILEAPGEYYFDPSHPNKPFPAYVNQIIARNNRKIWAVFVEPDYDDTQTRLDYVTRISKLRTQMPPKDKVLFIFNKIDLTPFVIGPGIVRNNEAIKNIKDLYPGIFVPFMNQNPITKWFKEYNCDFVPFQTGFYNDTESGQAYTEGSDIYPQKLWQKLLGLIRG